MGSTPNKVLDAARELGPNAPQNSKVLNTGLVFGFGKSN
jgi:hypothetical protein